MGAFRFAYMKQILKGKSLHHYSTDIVPKGHLAVYVGTEDQKKRFVVPISYLRQPSFLDLLNKAEQEFGFDHSMGGLTIPCKQEDFLNLTSKFHSSR